MCCGHRDTFIKLCQVACEQFRKNCAKIFLKQTCTQCKEIKSCSCAAKTMNLLQTNAGKYIFFVFYCDFLPDWLCTWSSNKETDIGSKFWKWSLITSLVQRPTFDDKERRGNINIQSLHQSVRLLRQFGCICKKQKCNLSAPSWKKPVPSSVMFTTMSSHLILDTLYLLPSTTQSHSFKLLKISRTKCAFKVGQNLVSLTWVL